LLESPSFDVFKEMGELVGRGQLISFGLRTSELVADSMAETLTGQGGVDYGYALLG
jgi:hypothetical protein